uniref:Uncharacterized protein n=1 Tax=Setaria italica TaxID=4555 RepID=K3YF53_SETIT
MTRCCSIIKSTAKVAAAASSIQFRGGGGVAWQRLSFFNSILPWDI